MYSINQALPKDFSLTPVNKPVPPELNTDFTQLPRHLKFSSNYEDNNISMVRTRLRKNLILHKEFDSFIESPDGRNHFRGVLDLTNPNQAEGNPASDDEPKNVYDFLIKNGYHKPLRRKRGDPVEVIPRLNLGNRNKKNNSVDIRENKQKVDPYNYRWFIFEGPELIQPPTEK